MPITRLEADALSNRLHTLVAQGRQIDAEFLIALAEYDRDKGYELHGYASLWDFCRRELGLLECATYRRTHTVRILQRFPAAIEHIRDGRLAMTTLVLLGGVLTEENAGALFDAAAGKSRRQIEALVAERKAPQRVPAPLIRRLPARELSPAIAAATELASLQPSESVVRADAAPVVATPVPFQLERPSAPKTEIRPVAADQVLVRFTARRSFVEKLERAKRLAGHAIPSGDLEALLDRALDLYIEKLGKRRGAIAVKQPARSVDRAKNGAGRVSAETRRLVWERDGGQCVWPLAAGGVCGSRTRLEHDHIVPQAKGGTEEPANIRLLCFAHNQQHAREQFGEAFMERHRRNATVAGRGRGRSRL